MKGFTMESYSIVLFLDLCEVKCNRNWNGRTWIYNQM